MARVAMAMSGGVDSSVAAALLKQQGHEVIGLHLKLYHGAEQDSRPKSCCSLDEAMDARAVCHRLEIPFYVLDVQEEFRSEVIDYFIREYQDGRTPNPCVMCNRTIKSRYLLKKADELDCELLATGHYARSQQESGSGGWALARPADLRKDQTYFLWGVERESLPRLCFPLADHVKPRVRRMASELDFAAADKPDSQEVCFVPRDYRQFLAAELPETPEPGEFVDTEGKVLGAHQGFPYYTVGQRRGLGVSAATPYYVVRLDRERNQVVLGKETDLASQTVLISGVNWVSVAPPEQPLRVTAKLRYSHSGTPATLHPGHDGTATVMLDEPVRAVTPGQAAAFYDRDVLLGGGWIEDSSSEFRTPVGAGFQPTR